MSRSTTRSSRLSTLFATLVIVTLVASSILGFGRGLLVGALVAGVVALAKTKAAKEESDANATAGNTYPLLALVFTLAIPTPAHADWPNSGQTLEELSAWDKTIAAPKTEQLIDSISELLSFDPATPYPHKLALQKVTEQKEKIEELREVLLRRRNALMQIYCTPFDFLNSAASQAVIGQYERANYVLTILTLVEEKGPQGRQLQWDVRRVFELIREIVENKKTTEEAVSYAHYILGQEEMEGNCHR